MSKLKDPKAAKVVRMATKTVGMPKLPYISTRDGKDVFASSKDDPRKSWLKALNSWPNTGGRLPTEGENGVILDGLAFLCRQPKKLKGNFAVLTVDATRRTKPVLSFVGSLADCEKYAAKSPQPDCDAGFLFMIFMVPDEMVEVPKEKPVRIHQQAAKEAEAKRLTKMLGRDGKVAFQPGRLWSEDAGSRGNLLVLETELANFYELPTLDWRAGNLDQQVVDALRATATLFEKAAARFEAKMKPAGKKKRKAA